jgi:hypothetical protein
MRIHQRTKDETRRLCERIIELRLYGLTWKEIDGRLGVRGSIAYLTKAERARVRHDRDLAAMV